MKKVFGFLFVLWMTVSSHVIHPAIFDDELDEKLVERHWNSELESIHDAEGDKCHAHINSHFLMEIDEEYRAKQERENRIGDAFVQKMKKKKLKSLRKMEQIKQDKESSQRGLLNDYDDDYDNWPVIWIPVVFHVLFEHNYQNLSGWQLWSQVQVLNKDFRANNSEIRNDEVPGVWQSRVGDSKIQFYIWYIERREVSDLKYLCASDYSLKNTSWGGLDGWDPHYFLNIWTCDLNDTLGYAEFPCLLDTSYEWKDGVVLNVNNVGSWDYDWYNTFYLPSYTYDLGRTATHEVGHWLNLRHIWGDHSSCNQSIATDYVSDTPPQANATYGCPNGTNSTNTCYYIDPEKGKDLPDMYINFMDYSNDACLFVFTEEQVYRMRAVLSIDGCRSWFYYNASNYTNATYFACDDGCPLEEDFLNDHYCDCSECEDEDYYTCDTCAEGCPIGCNNYTYCLGSSSGSTSEPGSTMERESTSEAETTSGAETTPEEENTSEPESSSGGAPSNTMDHCLFCLFCIVGSVFFVIL